MVADNPILNGPYEEPRWHYATDDSGALDYARIVEGRRIFAPEVQAIPIRQGPQAALFEINDRGAEYGTLLINLLRREVGLWRAASYPGTTRVTRELLTFWFLDPDRHDNQKLFFAQQEALETAIWLNEVAPASNVGQHALNQLRVAQTVAPGDATANLPRLAFKMATGTGNTTHELTMPVLHNLYGHVRDELPRKGLKRLRAEAKKEGKELSGEQPPHLPALVKLALDSFYGHYRKDYDAYRGLFEAPPVFIVVCSNVSVSKEVFKYIGGYEQTLSDGSLRPVPGHFDLFSNYDQTSGRPLQKPPTLLIDSDALENSGQISEDFKKVFADEIEVFRREYARVHGQGTAEGITEAEILREVVNTVGKRGTLGAHLRCVVSVSMLTEGWDANTVTHIMGLRAFGSQLLCEQVAGRALRRKSYFLQGYDKQGKPTEDKRKIVARKFPPEYAHIIGVPFKMFKGGTVEPPTPREVKEIRALPERREEHEIAFPNVVGYRVETHEGPVIADFSGLDDFEIDGTKYPLETKMANAFSDRQEKLVIGAVKEKREQEIVYAITKELINLHFSDDDGRPLFHRFRQLQGIVEEWYRTKIRLIGYSDPDFKKLITFFDPKAVCSHINRGIQAASRSTDRILPVLNYYNRTGSTAYVHGSTTREVYATTKSHVNCVVADTKSWEQIAAKTLEEIDAVQSYVKNAFLGFSIPYVAEGKDREYFPDFIARCLLADGRTVNLIVEITGMNDDKAEKKWHVENRWLPAVNAVREKNGWDEWAFVEVAGDIREIKRVLMEKIAEIDRA